MRTATTRAPSPLTSTARSRRLLLLLALAGSSGAAWSFIPAAHADVTQSPAPTTECSATIAGDSVAAHRRPNDPIRVRHDEAVDVLGSASSAVSHVAYQLRIAGLSYTFGDDFATSDTTWSGTVEVEDYARFGVGLYELGGTAQTATGVCQDRVYICVEGRSPFTTAAGLVASSDATGGLALLGRVAARRRSLTALPRGPLALGGGLISLGAVVLAQHACIRPLTPLTLSIVPIGAAIGPVAGIAFGIGRPFKSSSSTLPPSDSAPQQPRTEARNIYQYRASPGACLACRNHAQNKVFATADAMRRAHPGCRCTIDWRPVDQASYDAYFHAGLEYDPRRARA